MSQLEQQAACKICENRTDNEVFLASEKMFGLGGSYAYLSCAQCQCLQLLNPPADFSSFYPSDYYSYRLNLGEDLKSRLKRWVRVKRAAIVLKAHAFFPSLLMKYFPNAGLAALVPLKLQKQARILDVGCGNGELLFDLGELGFTSLTGVDPFVAADIRYANGAVVLKRDLSELEGTFDLIMMHHAFEHMDKPLDVLIAARKRLRKDGVLLIRIPVANAAAWHTYGTNWVQLDAPRHLYLHTKRSMGILAEQAGMKLQKVVYDSMGFQYWGSEMYKAGKPLVSDPSKPARASAHLFTKEKLKDFEAEARLSNLDGTGDQAAFYLALDNS